MPLSILSAPGEGFSALRASQTQVVSYCWCFLPPQSQAKKDLERVNFVVCELSIAQ